MSRIARMGPLVVLALGSMLQLAQAQPAVLGARHPQVDACYRAAANAETGELSGWSVTQPCVAALELDLNERERVATLVNLGSIQLHWGDFLAAQQNFDQALAINADYPDVYLNRGNLHYLRRDFEAAVRDYSEALRLNSRAGEILYLNRGMAYQNLGEFQLAEMDFRAALELRPEWSLVAEKLQQLEADRTSATNP